jgi:tetratricopeptide (TPR) repeat protein
MGCRAPGSVQTKPGPGLSSDIEFLATASTEPASFAYTADFLYARGESARAAELLEKALAMTAAGGYVLLELYGRLELVWVLLDLQRSAEAFSQLERCCAIMANGEDWRGVAARMARAEAVVAAAQRNYAEAGTHFEQSISILVVPWR